MFQFKHFSLNHDKSTLKIGTDSVLLAAYVPLESPHSIMDIGSGCGVIAFCIADRLRQENFSAQILGIDIDQNSVDEAIENASLFTNIDDKIAFSFQKIALQQLINVQQQRFDLIVSNPPFFSRSLKPEDVKRNMSKHCDDTLPFADLAACASQLLSPNGKFYLILPAIEGAEFESVAKKYFCLSEKVWIYPKENKPAHRVILGFSNNQVKTSYSEIIIRNNDETFHDSYKNLTKNFYLKF